MKFRDFSIEKIGELPKLSRLEVKILWISDYWDIPKNGLLSYQQMKYWFQVFDEMESGPIRAQYLVISLSASQLQKREKWHDDVEHNILLPDSSYDFCEADDKYLEELPPDELWSGFYESYQDRLPKALANNQLIGWFEE